MQVIISIVEVRRNVWQVAINGKPQGKAHTREGARTMARMLAAQTPNAELAQ
jgi:hypothetical protein